MLIMALLMAAILGIVLASYLDLAMQNLKSANLDHYKEVAKRETEAGLEIGLWLINNRRGFPGLDGSSTSIVTPDGTWTIDYTANTAKLVVAHGDIGRGRTGWTTVIINNIKLQNSNGIEGLIEAETVIKDADGNLESRQRISMGFEPRNLFPYGFSVEDELQFRYLSLDAQSYQPHFDYDTISGGSLDYHYGDNVVLSARRFDSFSNGSLNVNGMVFTSDQSQDDIGRFSIIHNSETVDLSKNIDSGLYNEGFSSRFPDLEAPSFVNNNVVSMPGTWTTIDFGKTIDSGYDPSTGIFHYKVEGDLGVGWGQKLRIDGPTVLEVTDDFYIDYGGEVEITGNGSLTLFVKDTFQVWGGKLDNLTKDPSKLVIVGSRESGDTSWYMYNDADFHGAMYGPRARFYYYGGNYSLSTGQFYGAGVFEDLDIIGDMDFYYDEAVFTNLVKDNRAFDELFYYAPTSWTESNPSAYLDGDPGSP